MILTSLRENMWRFAAWHMVVPAPLRSWLDNRINRAARRIPHLAARLAAGTLRVRIGPAGRIERRPAPAQPPKVPPPEALAPEALVPTPPASPPIPPRPNIPRGFGWLQRLVSGCDPVRRVVGGHTAAARNHLQYLLDQPDMQALLRAAPPIGRELRPICRMLGITPPPGLLPPPRKRQPKPRPEAPARLRKPVRRDKPRSKLRTLSDYGPPPPPGYVRPMQGAIRPPPARNPRST